MRRYAGTFARRHCTLAMKRESTMHLTQALHKARREHPGRTAMVCAQRRTSYVELADRVERLAGALRSLGVQPGDRVAFLGLNSDFALEVCYASWWAGAVLAPVNFRWSIEEMAFSLIDCGARVLVVDELFAPMVEPLRARVPTLETVISVGDAQASNGEISYEALIASASRVADAYRRGDDGAVLLYTGGTTGRSKGVLLSHGGLYATTLASISIGQRAPGIVCLHALPMFHVGGLVVMLQAMVAQDTQVMLPAFDPAAYLDLIERERVVESALVPTMIRRLIDYPALAGRALDSLERLYYGASPIDATLLEQTIARLPHVALTQFYGMTETSGIAVALPAWCHSDESRAKGRHLAAGLPTASMEVRIATSEGKECARGEIGEIWLRGPGVMLRYWNLPEATAQAVQDGWMRTGDAGRIDGDGLLYIVDRLKDMIVTGGENVYSVEVENAVLSLPGVAQCAVLGVPDNDWGERVHAVLVLQPGAAVDAAAVMAHCKQLIAGYKCPRSIEFRTELPVSGAGKLLKYKLREAYWTGRERQVA
ncbi:long-chain-fatty-acid--CoA ligase [Xylophilus sp. GW821-FHT01B05]